MKHITATDASLIQKKKNSPVMKEKRQKLEKKRPGYGYPVSKL